MMLLKAKTNCFHFGQNKSKALAGKTYDASKKAFLPTKTIYDRLSH